MSRILLVHHEPLIRHLLATFLEESGVEVIQSPNGEDAFRQLQESNSVQAIVLDLDVPGVSGWEFCRLLRYGYGGRFATIPFCCLSSRLSTSEGEWITGVLGGQAFVPLPGEPASFRHCMAEVLAGNKQLDSPRVGLAGFLRERMAHHVQAFQQHGWSVEECSRACDLPRQFEKSPPDLIVIHYPLSEGHDLDDVAGLREQFPSARMYMVTAHEDPQLALAALQYGVHEFIREPVDPLYLVLLFAKAEWERVSHLQTQRPTRANASSYPTMAGDLETFLSEFHEMVLLVDEHGVIVDVNTQARRVLNWPSQEICGHTLTILEPSAPLNWLIPSSRSRIPRKTQFCTRNGERRDVSVSVYSVSGDNGTRYVLVAKDLKELTDIQMEVHRLHEQVQGYKELESVGKLAGGIAHDVNNILTAIQGHASLLSHKGSTDASTHRPAEVIRQAAHRGQELTAQLLGTAPRGKERRTSINLHDTIDEVLSLVASNRTQGIQVVKNFEAQDAWIRGNARQLHQVFLNLLVNACDAMPQGGTLRISTACHGTGASLGASGNPQVEVTVMDTGCGIPQELRQVIFDPFFSTKPSDQSCGMGLAIVKEVIEAHGGHMTLSSEINHGTTFHLIFPQGQQFRSGLIHLPTVLGKSHSKVLVVDDDPLVAETTVEIVRLFDCDPLVVHSSEEAVDWYRDHAEEIDVIVLDLSMPTMSGERCFRALQAIHPSVKVVFSSGFDKTLFVQQLYDEGLAGFVQKPFDVEDLSLAFRHVLSQNQIQTPCALSGLVSATTEDV